MSSKRTERRAYVSEAFHSLNQPITSLHCILELALARPRSAEEYRQRIAEALENAGSVLRLARSLREVVEGDDPGDNLSQVPLHAILTETAREMDSLAELRGCSLQVEELATVSVVAEPIRLKRALAYVVEALLYEAAPNQAVKFSLHTAESMAVASVTAKKASEIGASRSSIDERLSSMHWSTAIQTLQAIGSEIKRECSGGQVAYRIVLPIGTGASTSSAPEQHRAEVIR